jgi:predicted deacylase
VLSAESLPGVEIAYFEVSGAQEGPRVTVIAGIHGCEYASMLGVRRFVRALDPEQLCGTLVAVPIVNVPAFVSRSPFVVPEDGKNLNRCFPGAPDGTAAERLAHLVFTELIRPSDYLLDCHAGDLPEDLEPFALYDESPVETAARAMAVAYGADYVIRNPSTGGAVGGSTSEAAASIGVPAIIAEAGGRGIVEEDAVERHVAGIGNVLRSLRMLGGETAELRTVHHLDRFLWLRSEHAGWWEPAVRVGSSVPAGGLLGTVCDPYGDELERIVAPEAGVPMFITSSPAVAADGLLLGLGAGERPV